MDPHDPQNDVVSYIWLGRQIVIYDDDDRDYQIGFFLVNDFLIESLILIVFVFGMSRLMIQIFFVFCCDYLTEIYSGTFLLSLAFLIYKVSLGNGLVFILQYLTSSLRYLFKRGFILLQIDFKVFKNF